jgi:tRNA (cytidine/uridine-2'-O-)-methyltransferase
MFHIILIEPEIPPNTGNLIRLSANTGTELNLIHPLGFTLNDKHLKRAGLDYHEGARVHQHLNFEAFREAINPKRLFAFSTKGKNCYADIHYQPGDAFVFGPETRGLSKSFLESCDPSHILRIPMLPNNRSLNLSNSVAIVVYEAWRQQGFSGGL